MNTRLILILLTSVFASGSAALAQQRLDPIAESMIQPGVLFEHGEEIGLDDGQKEFIQSHLREAQEKFQGLQQDLQKEVTALGELLKQEKPDEKKVIAQLDKVLDGEREIKRAQVVLMLAIRSKLTPAQVTKAREIQQKMMAQNRQGGPPESLRNKMQKVQELARKMQEDGKDPSAVRPLMEEIQPLMREGKFKEAEETLDKAIKLLSEGEKK